ncbi:MAG: glycosyltransferase family 4 protein [Candidatus Omnitrophica bacterium]|nr:glycosyltransferase family 4 protein [Candidatus Omnitrophota bacterium]
MTRADALLAIQEQEKQQLSEMCPQLPVILTKHACNIPLYSPSSPDSFEILYVGNMYEPNRIGLEQFITKTWPLIRKAEPRTNLLVCGRLAELVKVSSEGVEFVGGVDDLSTYYRRSAAVINPVPFGSGLKIKSVEALIYGRVLISTRAGVLGLETEDELPVLICEHGESMANQIIKTLHDEPFRLSLEKRSQEYARKWFRPGIVYSELTKFLVEHTTT